MSAYGKFCEKVGVSPVWYGVACVVGALAMMGAILLQKMERYEGAAFWCLPLAYVPFVLVQLSVRGTEPPSERVGKMFHGIFFTMFLSFFPGGVIGMMIAEWLW